MQLTVSKSGNTIENFDFSELISVSDKVTFLIGRSSDCHVVLDDKKISRNHVEIEFDGKNYFVKVKSQVPLPFINGSPVNGTRTIESKDLLLIGEYAIEFEIPEIEKTLDNESSVNDNQAKTQEVESSIVIPDDLPADNIPEPLNEGVIEADTIGDNALSLDDDLNDLDELGGVDSLDDLDDISSDENIESQELSIEDDGEDLSLDDAESNEDIFDGDNSVDESEETQVNDMPQGDFLEDNNYDSAEEIAEQETYDEPEGFENDFSEGEFDDFQDDQQYEVSEYDTEDSTQLFTGFAKYSLELFGESAPYDTFNITEEEVLIGRDPNKCQIVLNDPEVSTSHAVIKRVGGVCILEDLKSANGTILNGKRINKKEILNEDEFIIGSTTFTVYVGNDFIDSQKETLMPVEDNQEVVVEEIVEVSDDEDIDIGEDGEGHEEEVFDNSLVGKFKRLPTPRKIIYIFIAVAIGFVMMPETKNKKNDKKAEKQAKQSQKDSSVNVQSKLSPDQIAERDSYYQLARAAADERNFEEASFNLDKSLAIDPNYIQAKQLSKIVKNSLAKIAELNEEKRKEQEAEQRRKEVAELVKRAATAVKDRNVELARKLFQEIKIKDPRNFDVTALEAELNGWMDQENKKKLEEVQRVAERKKMVSQLQPGKALFLKEDWYNAIGALEKFMQIKQMDEDLLKEGAGMLKKSKEMQKEVIGPLLGKARSLKEGEDLKAAYQTYSEVLRYDPSLIEALNEMADINATLTLRAKRVFREAIISESLGLFEEAKSKYQEVQQIAPIENEYYEKATERLESLL